MTKQEKIEAVITKYHCKAQCK